MTNNLERIKINFREWLVGAGEIEILLLLDSIVEELEARGRPFPAQIPCFGAFWLHRPSHSAAGVRESARIPERPRREQAVDPTRRDLSLD